MTATESPTRQTDRYDPQSIEQKWRDRWDEAELYKWRPDDTSRPKWNAVTMYPYPSGNLHIGHWYAMAPPDAAARYRRMQGYNVFFPMGFDAFGLPAENAAITRGVHPYKWTMENIENMRRQMRSMGAMFDWNQEVVTCDPEYYKWNQWFFLKFYDAGLAVRKEAPVWWCPNCQTVLANEQVVDGRCERCETEVYQRRMTQWFFKITDYADELLNFDGIDWPDPIKTMQTNWIGRSEGANVTFKIGPKGRPGDEIEVFTTRPDTLWGASFMVLAPEHPLVEKITTDEQREEVEQYKQETARRNEITRQSTATEKTGVFTGGYATNPVNGEQIPVWIADYVLMSYGTGAIMAVPAHDERDFAFSLKYGLPIVPVIERPDGVTRAVALESMLESPGAFEVALTEGRFAAEETDTGYEITLNRDNVDAFLEIASKHVIDGGVIGYAGARTGGVFLDEIVELASVEGDRKIADWTGTWTAMEFLTKLPFLEEITFHTDYGTMINSGELTGTPGDEAISATNAWLEQRGVGRSAVTYRLRDWLVSRQRYWGTPIPMIYCDECGIVPVPEEDLPVVLPEDAEFKPTGESPLRTHEAFLNVDCPKCGGHARREIDTMDTFVDSSWYQYRYMSPHNDTEPFDNDLAERWLPVDQYTGGREHAVMHLMYTRFWTKAMRDIGMLNFSEPFNRLRNQGFVLGEDGEKMSKSCGNVIDPDDLIESLGADTVRLFIMFMRPWDMTGPWDNQGITGVRRFLDRAWSVVVETVGNPTNGTASPEAVRDLQRLTHQTLREVTKSIEAFSFNTMVARLMEYVNELMKLKDEPVASTEAWREATRPLSLMLAPSAPHITEELWQRMGYEFSIHTEDWPDWSEELAADDVIDIPVQVNGKVRGRITIPAGADSDSAIATARADENVARYLDSGSIAKEIYVPGRWVNFVVR
ncbi:class I tRNA ligase family protein [soil metagenome]